MPGLSTGLLSATQGSYTTAQFLLDLTQGARVSGSAYSPPQPRQLALLGRQIAPWAPVRRRAAGAPQILDPGLLAASIPGGGAYAGVAPDGRNGASVGAVTSVGALAGAPLDPVAAAHLDAVAGANRAGRLGAVSLGSAATLPARIAALRRHARFVVADLPTGPEGYAQLRALSAARAPRELLLVVQRAPDTPGHELLWAAVGGLGGGRTLSSQSTEERGLIATIDLAPTILSHLGLATPAAMRGTAIHTDGTLAGASLRGLKRRLAVVYGRRLPALAWLLVAWIVLLLLSALGGRARGWGGAGGRETGIVAGARGGDRGRGADIAAGVRGGAGGPEADIAAAARRRAAAMRIGALALLWTPVAEFLPAALEPSAAVEYALLVASAFALGALSDRLLRWPRAPIAPALAALVALSADALGGTQLLMRSLLGPNPIFGARFYGIGNELKSGLAVLVFAAVAGALYPAVRGRRAAGAMAFAGIVLAVIEGSARIGAGVGGVILVSAGTAVATLLLLGGSLSRRRAPIVLASPVIGLLALAAIDLATAHGSGHFTGSILHARSAGDLRDVIERRYLAAWDELKHGAMPIATALALLAGVLGVRARDRLLAPVGSDPAWLAALAGGLTAGVIGALSEDSGPVLLVVAVFALACVLGYLWGRPPREQTPTPRSADTLRAARSRARTPPGALSR